MDLNALKVFVKTAEQRSFTDAAALLEMTQSGVSRAVSRLETALKVKLLNRTTRSLSLTPDGQAFYDRCSRLLRELDEAEQQVVARRDEPTGVLRITSSVGYARSVLLPVLTQLTNEYPGLTIETAITNRIVDLTEEGFDAAIRAGNIPDSRLVARELGMVHLVTIAAPAYLKRFGTPKTPDELQQHNCLLTRLVQPGRPTEWRFRENGRERRMRVSGNIVMDDEYALIDLAIQGQGIVQTLRFMAARANADKEVVPILENYATTVGPLWLVYPQSRQLSSKIRVLRSALVKATF